MYYIVKSKGNGGVVMDEYKKIERILEVFFRGIRGEELSVKKLADEYGVSTRSVSRDLDEIKVFLAEHRELIGHTELEYNYQTKKYQLNFKDFLQSNELFAVVKVLLGSRAFKSEELLLMISKFKGFVSSEDRKRLEELIRKEVYHYQEIRHDSKSVIENVWKLANYIEEKREITITYYKMNRNEKVSRIRPQAIIFSEYYFYLVSYHSDDETYMPIYYRVDRIIQITAHREKFEIPKEYSFDEGEFRKKILFMWTGRNMKIRFEFTGPSVQAILDRIPTAKIVETQKNKYIIEAEILGDGIKMYLLSQGAWVKVLSPQSLLEEMKREIVSMQKLYQ
ncbi:MAG: hypothetical protein K0R54_5268 [Clostridiaceae bacterium]|jgi:predicted DNA-binding transcriptional regulator YafY|nr:hypothetical protein [Clostridiaceae bacterium]